MDSFWLELRYAARALRRTPYVTIAAALSIGLGVGVTAAIYSWIDGTVIHPFPAVADESRLVGIEVGEPNNGMGAWSYQTYKELRAATHSFSGMAAWRIVRVAGRERREAGSSPLLVTTVTGNYFDVLGVRPVLGRAITDADVDARAPVAVVGNQYWADRYHSDPNVIGRTLLLNGQAVTVVGVAPPRFSGIYTGVVPQLYAPLTLQPILSGVNTLDDRKNRSWLVFARLAPGVSIDAARRDADTEAKRITASYGDRPAPGADTRDLRLEFLGGTLSPMLSAMLGVSALLLLLASANVATLLLVRHDGRRGEVALRRALGASSWRVVRIPLLESAMLAFAGTIIGIAAAYVARGTLYSLIPRGSFALSLPITINWRLLVAALGGMVGVTVACAVGPSLATIYVPANDVPLGQSNARSVTRGRGALRGTIVSVQLALSMVALVLASMFTRGLQNAASVDIGFSNPGRVLLVDTDLNAARLAGERGIAAVDQLLQRLRSLPGVGSATVASMVPLGFGGRRVVEVTVEGYAAAPNENMSAERAHVGPDYARTMGIRVVRGRDMSDRDRAGTLRVALVNEAFANRFFRGADPIGRRVDAGGGWATIVGVLHDGKYDRLDESLHPVVYVPTLQWFLPGMTIHVRASGDARALGEPVRRALQSVNVDLPAVQTRTLAEHISASTFVPRTGAMVIGVFALMALALAAIGLYGALAFSVALKGREIALRLALGARSAAIAGRVARQALVIAGAGIALGGVLALIFGSLLRAQIPAVAPGDPVIALGTVFVLLVVTAVASWIPARHAMRVDPATALRAD